MCRPASRFFTPLALTCIFVLCLVTASSPIAAKAAAPAPPLPAPVGVWGTASNHNVNVGPGFVHVPPPGPNGQRLKMLHLALIPQPSVNEGLVVGWGTTAIQQGGGWFQRWSVIDPSTDPITVLWNDELFFPGAASGDLFCSGHTWSPDGRLIVFGGTTFYPGPGQSFGGGKMVLVYDPTPLPGLPYGQWTSAPDMEQNRWYPTGTTLGSGLVMVSGGTHNGNQQNSYELLDPATMQWVTDNSGNRTFPGPSPNPVMGNYSRIHVLSDGTVFWSSPQRKAARLDLTSLPGTWSPFTNLSSVHRHDGASILYPQAFGVEDLVAILGGSDSNGTHSSVEGILPKQSPSTTTWAPGPSMNRERVHLNTVILPDATLLSFGGNINHTNPTFWFDAEWFDGSSWFFTPNGASRRDYHSTAALLPDGRVLTAGGDNRDFDYQLFYPPYLQSGLPRPQNVTVSSTTIRYYEDTQNTYTARATGLPDDALIARAVLMAPASTTHHSDMHQRYVDLPVFSSSSTSITFGGPFNNCRAPNPWHSCAPPGYYMLFLVTNQGMPSNAVFVQVR